jgi:hypothetical protein
MANALEKKGELVDDAVNEVGKLMEKWKNRLTLDNLRLSERYLEGNLEILVHLVEQIGGCAKNHCAVLKYREPVSGGDGRSDLHQYTLRGKRVRKVNCGILHSASDHKKEAMLVADVELMEFPEVVITTIVGLEGPDNVYRSRTDSLYFSKELGFAFGGQFKNREEQVRTSLAASDFNELPDQMVQTTVQIMDAVPCDQRKDRGRVCNNTNPVDGIPRLRVLIGDQSIRVCLAEGLGFPFKISDVLFGPFDFRPDAT